MHACACVSEMHVLKWWFHYFISYILKQHNIGQVHVARRCSRSNFPYMSSCPVKCFFKKSFTTVVTAHVLTYVTNTVYVNKFLIHFFMFLRHHTLSTHEFWLLDLLQRSNNNDLQCSELVFRYILCFGLFCFCSSVHVGARMDPKLLFCTL